MQYYLCNGCSRLHEEMISEKRPYAVPKSSGKTWGCTNIVHSHFVGVAEFG
jgi:hypothetical protein